MNWKRGLYRLWFILTAFWAVGWTLHGCVSLSRAPEGMLALPPISTHELIRQIVALAFIIVVPPTILLGLGHTAAWVLRGFTVRD